ncbi:ABC transporter permease [Microbacterium sp. X-17]|uniref:ABC transporter permease n=1 Tax=Microbacterium sp. X-17 TaxID=3144404 RepID=UPI0031F536B7
MIAIGKRVLIGAATLLGVSLVMFIALSLIPGDAAQVALGQQATPEKLELLRAQYGLDRPLWQQYLDWLGGLAHGDLGSSVQTGRPIWESIAPYVANSAVLAGLAILIMIPLAIALGVTAAVKRDSVIDHIISSTGLTWASTPEFVIGTLLILVFTNWLGILPATAIVDPSRPVIAQITVIALPLLTLIFVSIAQSSRMIRASMITVLGTDYIQAARLRGVPQSTIVWRHALPNAASSIIAIVVLTVGWLVGGVVVTESLFQYPGLGVATTNAVNSRDTPTVLACCILITFVLIVANVLADVVSGALDPRLRRRKA